jgi:hypothetical protein
LCSTPSPVFIPLFSGFLAKETLSAAADQMRQIMVEDSKKFAGVTDGTTTLGNLTGTSEGVRGDGQKIGGTRVDLDLLCGADNQNCKVQRNQDNTPALDANGKTQLLLNTQGQVQFDPKEAQMSLAAFLETEAGKKLSGPTGGVQGAVGTLFGTPYVAGSWQDKLIEAFAGTHDMVGGKLSGLYDEQGNATRGRRTLERGLQDTWSATGAIAVSTPFAASEVLPPEVWNAISVLLRSAK